MAELLLPCPFCGYPGEVGENGGVTCASHMRCNVEPRAATAEDWNRRASQIDGYRTGFAAGLEAAAKKAEAVEWQEMELAAAIRALVADGGKEG